MDINLFGRTIFLSKGVIAVLLTSIVVVLGGTGYAINNNMKGIVIESAAEEEMEKEEDEITAESNEDKSDAAEEKVEEINVYIVGCVNKPGLVTLIKGQLVFDAINAAGGATEEADIENVNMAYKLQDNVMLKINSKKEASAVKKSPAAQPAVLGNNAAGKGIEITTDSKGVVVGEQAVGMAGGKIDINTADVAQLDTLPGVGPETAKDIVAYREKNGGFKKPEDIMKIPGIKTSKFNKMKDSIVAN